MATEIGQCAPSKI